MIKMTGTELVHAIGGETEGPVNMSFHGLATDSREDSLLDRLFIPLKGENFDGHEYIPQAINKGATHIVTSLWKESWRQEHPGVFFLKVDDTLVALQELSAFWRRKLKGTVLGLTGSNGKTTTKDFLAQMLTHEGLVTASRGSFNNHWGVPRTLCMANEDDNYVVAEMGMNHPGELKDLSRLVQADIVAITNVGRAHTGFFKSIEDIADAKEEIYRFAPESATLVVNVDNPWTRSMLDRYSDRHHLTFSTQKDSKADVVLSWIGSTQVEGSIGGSEGRASVHFWGRHNLENLACATTMALAAGVKPEKLWDSFSDCHTGWGRNQWIDLQSGGQVLFDGYNANPESFSALVQNLPVAWPEHEVRVGVFGEMRELGSQTAEAHRELGESLAQLTWDQIIFWGPSGADFTLGWKAGGGVKSPVIINSYEEFLDLDKGFMLNPKALVVVKGSRGQKLERVVQCLSPVKF